MEHHLKEHRVLMDVYLLGWCSLMPTPWMMWGATPFSAKDVASPAHIDCPPTSLLKKTHKYCIKNDLVGMTPFPFSHKGDDRGKRWSQDLRYATKRIMGLQGKGLGHRIIVFPLKNLLALWPGRENWKELSLINCQRNPSPAKTGYHPCNRSDLWVTIRS